MTHNRRTFIKSAVSSGAALLLGAASTRVNAKPSFSIPPGFTPRMMATNWGFDGTTDQFCEKVKKAGYDGVEVGLPSGEALRTELLAAVRKNTLDYAFLVGVWGVPDYTTHFRNFEKNLRDAAAAKPIYINCHAGKDYFTFEQNKSFIDLTSQVSLETGVPIYHETHRGRILFATPVTKTFLNRIPNLRLTLDISHWCAVHESLLADQAEIVEETLKHTDHIHVRVGHAEGPQVNDPRAPEWKEALDAHLAWWDKVVQYKIKSGVNQLTFLTEFGPLDYMQALPFSRQPVANQWDINVHMMHVIRERYGVR